MAALDDQAQQLRFWREELLRRASQALQGRLVGLWEATGSSVVPVAVSLGRALPSTAAAEINGAIRSWSVGVRPGSRWLAARLDMGRWCIAAVRTDVPAPPPHGVERRKKERVALELAGLAMGLIEQRAATESARDAVDLRPAQPQPQPHA